MGTGAWRVFRNFISTLLECTILAMRSRFFSVFRLANFAVSLTVVLGCTAVVQAQCRFPEPKSGRSVTYRFQPEFTADALLMHVTLELQMGTSGSEVLGLPMQWAGETLHSMSNLRTTTDGASLADGQRNDEKILYAPFNQPVVIAYDLKKDWTGPLINPLQFHPVLMPEYFEFTGNNALVRLTMNAPTETVNFDWQNLPASWSLATSFGTSTSTVDRCQTYSGPPIDALQGLYAAGDFRIRKFQIGTRTAILAVRGKWTFTDDDAIVQLQKVIGTVRDFWQDDNFPYFLVTLKPYDRDHGSSDGSAFTNAFWMYVSRLDPLAGLLPQLAHEAFHEWNPMRMGDLPRSDSAVDWFKEGFTSYYGDLLVFRSGAMTATEYIDSLNRDLQKFPSSDDPSVRGRVIALWIDGTLRSKSNNKLSLDDIMFDMVRTRTEPYTLDRILKTAERYLPPEAHDVLERAVSNRGMLPAPDSPPWLGACVHSFFENQPTFDLGLDLRQSTKGEVSGVVQGGPAFTAGLRDGQKVTRVSVYNGDPTRLAQFWIRGDDGEKLVEFYPRGKGVEVWQYRVDPSVPCVTP